MLPEGLATALTLLLQNTLGALPGFGGLREVQGMQTGEIISDRLELAFKGVSKRSFQYTFKMIPKSKAEADEIRNIIFMFKSNMLPEFSSGSEQGRRMIVPNTFDIRYMYQGGENDYLHKIGTCVLENMSVSYGGDKYRTYSGVDGDGAPPVEVIVTAPSKLVSTKEAESTLKTGEGIVSKFKEKEPKKDKFEPKVIETPEDAEAQPKILGLPEPKITALNPKGLLRGLKGFNIKKIGTEERPITDAMIKREKQKKERKKLSEKTKFESTPDGKGKVIEPKLDGKGKVSKGKSGKK